jgi:hypothetical protein
MKCITSPMLDDTQILRYVEGEADDAIVAHIQNCPYCAERASQMALFQNRLRARLYRSTCPSSMELGDYHLGLLPKPQELVIAQHVRECPLCRREVAELKNFMDDTTLEVGLLGAAQVLIARLIGGEDMGQESTELTSAPSFGGLRGGEGEEPFIYQAGNVRIVIEVQDDVEQMGLKTLLGLVTGLETNEFTIQVSRGDQVIATTSVDEIGNFIIPHLAPSHYKLILTGPNMEIHIPSLPV